MRNVSPGEPTRPHTHTHEGPTALHLSSAPFTNSMSVVSNSTDIEQELERRQRRVEALEAELHRIKEAASGDLQSAHNDLMAKNREIGRLKKELADFHEEQPESGEVRDLLILWKHKLNKNSRTYIGADGKRWKIAQSALKRWGQARCEQAIIGLSLHPWSGPRGRAAQHYPGASRDYTDIEHALGDEVRMEKLVAVAKLYERPTLLDEPVGPEPTAIPEPAPQPAVPAADRKHPLGDAQHDEFTDPPPGLLTMNPTKGRPAGYFDGGWRDTTPPITKVLTALHQGGHQVITHAGKPDSWSAQCPAHEDRSPSLAIHRKPDGMVLVHCFAGCHVDEVMYALRLEVRDLWTATDRDYDCANERDGVRVRKVIPPHLRHAMRQMLELEERHAA